MFEKEAEEYVMRIDVITENDRVPFDNGYGFQTVSFEDEVKKGFIDGAEIGYNKAKEDADKMKSQFLELCNLKDMRIEKLEKANEWHYVKDGDYPKDNKPVLCILGDIDSDNCEVGYYNDVGSGEPWHFETYHLPDDDGDNAWGVIAWKEIVLPEIKEIKEND